MATGRSTTDYQRIYIGGYDLSGYVINSGEQGVEYPEYESATLADPIKGVLVGKPKVTLGPIQGVFDSTATTGWNVLANAAIGTKRYVTIANGVRAVPAMGDDVFCAPMYQKAYKVVGSDILAARLDLAGVDVVDAINYDEYWGKLLHAIGSETAANTATTNVDNGAATTAGGWMMYQITSITGSGTVTISIDDSANGTDYLALSGATTGAIATASAPTSGIIQLAITATVRRYLRWQIAFGGSATACTFALTFMRGR